MKNLTPVRRSMRRHAMTLYCVAAGFAVLASASAAQAATWIRR
ncbi:hypothetical protein [Miltoncostaea oceani]|nr:hypothetical protein [Miltoncostaea oceani]